MSNQKTLKDKAKTPLEIREILKTNDFKEWSCKYVEIPKYKEIKETFEKTEWVLLSDAEVEIQQLQDQLKDITAIELKLGELQKQIETAKRFIIEKRKQLKKEFGINEIKALWQNQLLDDFEKYVFGEKTP